MTSEASDPASKSADDEKLATFVVEAVWKFEQAIEAAYRAGSVETEAFVVTRGGTPALALRYFAQSILYGDFGIRRSLDLYTSVHADGGPRLRFVGETQSEIETALCPFGSDSTFDRPTSREEWLLLIGRAEAAREAQRKEEELHRNEERLRAEEEAAWAPTGIERIEASDSRFWRPSIYSTYDPEVEPWMWESELEEPPLTHPVEAMIEAEIIDKAERAAAGHPVDEESDEEWDDERDDERAWDIDTSPLVPNEWDEE